MYLSTNLRFLRKSRSLTQAELAEQLGLKRSSLATYEEERAEPKLSTLIRLAAFFNIDAGTLLNTDMRNARFGKRDGPEVLAITLDDDGEENISLIPEKAAAGYLHGYSDPEYLGTMAQFKMPFNESQHLGTQRIFQINGDSMLPIPSGSYLLCSYLEQYSQLKSSKLYVFISQNDGIVFKRAGSINEKKETIELISDNSDFESLFMPLQDILEIWKVEALISFIPDYLGNRSELHEAFEGLKNSVDQFANALKR